MRAPSSWLSHPRFKATWVAFAAGSLAGLAVLGACSDSTVSQVTGLRAPTAPRFAPGVVGDLSHTVQVCVDVASDPAPGNVPYTFVGAELNEFASPFPWFERTMTQAEVDAEEAYVTSLGFTSNSYGPFNAVTDHDVVTTNPSVMPGGPCANVFVRANTCAGGNCTADPASHLGNRMWDTGSNVINKYGTVSITANVPPGYTFTLSCSNDDPGNPQSSPCVDGGFSSANVFHGSSFTYTFHAPEETPCPAGLFTSEIADGVGEEKWPAGGVGDLLIRYDQFPAPNDNSYGVNAVGWDGGHTFGNLVGSDKAGVQIRNSSGTVVLSFNMDYISQKAGTPSGYGSGGVTNNEGDMLVGTADGISVTTSLANNLNTTGYCVAGNCSGGGTNLLVNSPPTLNNTTYELPAGSPYTLWDFHNTYYARISAAKLAAMGFNASTWTVQPNLTALHNSPDKDCPLGPFNCDDITVGDKEVNKKEVKVDVNNISTTQDAFVTGVHVTWPQGTNGNLLQVKVGGDVIWTGSIGGGTADLTLAQLATDANKRKIGKKGDEDLKFIFANNASTTLASYTASLDFGDACNKPILP